MPDVSHDDVLADFLLANDSQSVPRRSSANASKIAQRRGSRDKDSSSDSDGPLPYDGGFDVGIISSDKAAPYSNPAPVRLRQFDEAEFDCQAPRRPPAELAPKRHPRARGSVSSASGLEIERGTALTTGRGKGHSKSNAQSAAASSRSSRSSDTVAGYREVVPQRGSSKASRGSSIGRSTMESLEGETPELDSQAPSRLRRGSRSPPEFISQPRRRFGGRV